MHRYVTEHCGVLCADLETGYDGEYRHLWMKGDKVVQGFKEQQVCWTTKVIEFDQFIAKKKEKGNLIEAFNEFIPDCCQRSTPDINSHAYWTYEETSLLGVGEVNDSNHLSLYVMEAPSIDAFKNRLGIYLQNTEDEKALAYSPSKEVTSK